MNVKIKDYDTGWYGIIVSLKRDEVEGLIERLNRLKNNETSHFHFRSAFEGEGGVGDIEFNLQVTSPDNMELE